MEYTGIIKYYGVRTGTSNGQEWKRYDYAVIQMNTDGRKGIAFSANETMNEKLKQQGMADGAFGTVQMDSTISVSQTDKGIWRRNNIYPISFGLYKIDEGSRQDGGPKQVETLI